MAHLQLDESHQLHKWQSHGDSSHVVSKIGQYDVSVGMLVALRPNTWITDEVVNSFGRLVLESLYPITSSPSWILNSFFMTKLLSPERSGGFQFHAVREWPSKCFGGDIFRYHKLLIPVHVNGNHWALIEINFHLQKVLYFDSLKNDGSVYLEASFRFLKEYHLYKLHTPLRGNWRLSHGMSPVQSNGNDCGVFLCAALLQRWWSLPLSMNPAQSTMVRRAIGNSLIQAALSRELADLLG
jgi:sentrin-specific protease 1